MSNKKISPIAMAGSLALASSVLALMPAAAQGPSLAGKNVTMVIGFGPGGGYDAWGRVVARYIGKHLPGNHNVVPQNMPGGGRHERQDAGREGERSRHSDRVDLFVGHLLSPR